MATLVLLYNGLPAAIISIFAAVVVRRHLDVPARVLGRRLRLVDLPAELHFDHRYLHAQDALRELLRGMAWWLCIVPSIIRRAHYSQRALEVLMAVSVYFHGSPSLNLRSGHSHSFLLCWCASSSSRALAAGAAFAEGSWVGLESLGLVV